MSSFNRSNAITILTFSLIIIFFYRVTRFLFYLPIFKDHGGVICFCVTLIAMYIIQVINGHSFKFSEVLTQCIISLIMILFINSLYTIIVYGVFFNIYDFRQFFIWLTAIVVIFSSGKLCYNFLMLFKQ